MNGNNVMEGDANNRSNMYTSCTNDDNENKYGHVLMSIGYYCMQQYSQIRDEICGSLLILSGAKILPRCLCLGHLCRSFQPG